MSRLRWSKRFDEKLKTEKSWRNKVERMMIVRKEKMMTVRKESTMTARKKAQWQQKKKHSNSRLNEWVVDMFQFEIS